MLINNKALLRMEEEMKLRNYSNRTVQTYMWCIKEYFKFDPFAAKRCDVDRIKRFLLYKKEKGVGPVQNNLYLNAIKYFYQKVIKSPIAINISFAKRPKILPRALSHRQVLQILSTYDNYKHKLLISLAYGAGLRVSEAINLKVRHLHFMEDLILIKCSKGAKDRFTLLPQKLKEALKRYVRNKDHNDYVFQSNRGGKLHPRTAQRIFKNGLKKAKINKDASFHSLRHSFATQLIENGTNIRYVQELLGHRSLRTTQIYTQVTMRALKHIDSPL